MAELLFGEDFKIDNFISNFKQGARAYMFYCGIQFPGGILTHEVPTHYLVRSSSIPGHTIEMQEVPWQGHMYKLGGKSTVEDWTVTFIVDAKAGIYQSFLAWTNLVHNMETNAHGDPTIYMQDQQIQLLNPTGSDSILTVKLIKAWPSAVANMEVAYDSAEIATFDVTFTYQRHQVV